MKTLKMYGIYKSEFDNAANDKKPIIIVTSKGVLSGASVMASCIWPSILRLLHEPRRLLQF